jgi:hypothetical protein
MSEVENHGQNDLLQVEQITDSETLKRFVDILRDEDHRELVDRFEVKKLNVVLNHGLKSKFAKGEFASIKSFVVDCKSCQKSTTSYVNSLGNMTRHEKVVANH